MYFIDPTVEWSSVGRECWELVFYQAQCDEQPFLYIGLSTLVNKLSFVIAIHDNFGIFDIFDIFDIFYHVFI